MKQYLARVVEKSILWSNLWRITLDAPELSSLIRPGQCTLVRDPLTADPYLRHTAWLYQASQGRLSVTCSSPEDNSIIERAAPGYLLDLLAPIGRPLELGSARHILCLGEDEQVTHLIPSMHAAVSRGGSLVLWMKARAAESSLPAHLLPPQVEYRTGGDAPESELLTWADKVLACGSEEMYHALGDWARSARYRLEPEWAFVLRSPRMPCGTGACYACGVNTRHGFRLACTDGPFFDLREIETRRTA